MGHIGRLLRLRPLVCPRMDEVEIGLGVLVIGIGMMLCVMAMAANLITEKQEETVAQVDDLKAAVDAVDAKLDEVMVSVQAVIAMLGGDNPDVAAAIAQLQAISNEAQAIKDAADAAAGA